jgi:hypothetical protein
MTVIPYKSGTLAPTHHLPPPPPPFGSHSVLTAWCAEFLSRLWLLTIQNICCAYENLIVLADFFLPNARRWNFS